MDRWWFTLLRGVTRRNFWTDDTSTWQENPLTRTSSSPAENLYNASTARRWDTKPSHAESLRHVPGVRCKDTTTSNARQSNPSASHAEAPTNLSAETAGSAICPFMHKTLRILQLNVRKSDEVHQSLMNDKELRQYEAIAVQEPHARMIDGQVVTNPMGHSNWTK